MNTCKTCEEEYRQGGSDPTLLLDECMFCELVRLREETERMRGRRRAIVS